jgi:hypothetical protein
MAKSIDLNRVPGESDIGDQRDVADIAHIEAASKDPHRINGKIRSGVLAP